MRFQYGLRSLLIATTMLALFLGLTTWTVGDGLCMHAVTGVPDVFAHFFTSRQVRWFGRGHLPLLLAVVVGSMCAMLWQEKRRPLFLLLFLAVYFFSLAALPIVCYWLYPMRFFSVMFCLSVLSVVEAFARRLGRRPLCVAALSCVFCLGLFFSLQCEVAMFFGVDRIPVGLPWFWDAGDLKGLEIPGNG